MRTYLVLIVLLLLAACQTAQEAEVQQASALGAAAEAIAGSDILPNLLGVQTARPEREAKYQVVDSSMPAKEGAECKAKGGIVRMELAPAPMEYCDLPPTDIGQACHKADDCQGVCAATTKQCAEHVEVGSYYLGADGKAYKQPFVTP